MSILAGDHIPTRDEMLRGFSEPRNFVVEMPTIPADSHLEVNMLLQHPAILYTENMEQSGILNERT